MSAWLKCSRQRELSLPVTLDERIGSGLLFYSATNEIIRIEAARNEMRGLMIARNELASYLFRGTMRSINTVETTTIDDCEEDSVQPAPSTSTIGLLQASPLPAPIDDMRTCKRCYAADSCMLYRTPICAVSALAIYSLSVAAVLLDVRL